MVLSCGGSRRGVATQGLQLRQVFLHLDPASGKCGGNQETLDMAHLHDKIWVVVV